MTKAWMVDTVERVIRTAVQSWLAAWIAIAKVVDPTTASKQLSGPVFDLFAPAYLFAGLLGGVTAFVTCLAASQTGNKGVDASFVKAPPTG